MTRAWRRDVRVAVFLASRSLRRGNLSVTLMTVLMMAVVFISVVFLPSLINGAVTSLQGQVTDTATSDLTVSSAKDASIHHSAGLVKKVSDLEGVDAVTATRRVGNQVSHGDLSNAWGVDAVDPDSYAAVFTTPDHMIEGDWLTPTDTEGVVLGIDIAGADQTSLRGYAGSLKHVHVGDEVEVELLGGSTVKFTVRGIYQNRFALSDQGAFITTAAADALQPTTDYAAAVEDLYGATDQLTHALDAAHDGAQGLASGQAALADASTDLAQAAHQLADQAGRLATASAHTKDGARQLATSTSHTATSAHQLATAADKLSDTVSTTVVPAADTAARDAADTAKTAAGLAASCPTEVADPQRCAEEAALAEDAAHVAEEVGATAAQLHQVSSSVSDLATSTAALDQGAARLATAASDLSDGTTSLATGVGSLESAAHELADAAGQLSSQADALDRAAHDLAASLDTNDATATIDPAATDDDRAEIEEALAAPKNLSGPNTATRIYVKTEPGASLPALEEAIDRERDDLQYQTSAELTGAIQDQIDSFTLINNIMRVISLLVAAITVFILTYVELTNRRRQIGIERAIGIRGTAITISYALKAAISALIGITLGLLAYRTALIPFVQRHPFQFPNGDVVLVASSDTTRTNVTMLIIVAILAALIPTVAIIRMKLLDAIWGR